MLAGTPVESLARRLLQAERTRTPIDPLTDEHPDLTERDAYRIQEVTLEERGEPCVGYKLGFTSEAMRRQMGIPGPNHGRLTRSMLVDADAGPIPTSALIHPRVEPEVALLVEEDLAGPGLMRTEVYPAVRLAFAALEVVDSRFRDYRFRLEDNTADNSSAARFVLGAPVSLMHAPDLRLMGALLWKDGRVIDSGVGANAMGDPLSAVAWLANRLGEAGEVLEGRSVVLTGGLTRAHPVGAGGTFVAEFGGLGAVKVHFEGGSVPVVKLTMMEGRTAEQKEALIRRLSEAAGELDCPPEEVRVVIYEVSKNEWGIGGKSVAKREGEAG